MANLSYAPIIISSNQRKDGSYLVYIRVTLHGKSRKIPTNITCYKSDLNRQKHIKNPDILDKTTDLIRKMKEAMKDYISYDLEHRDIDWVIGKIKDNIEKKEFRLDFFEWADTLLAKKKPSTAGAYKPAISAFARFLGKRELDINSITKSMILDFIDYLKRTPRVRYDHYKKISMPIKGKPKRTAIAFYVRLISHIFESAKKQFNDPDSSFQVIPRSPFSTIDLGHDKHDGERALSIDTLWKIINTKETRNEAERRALDVFIVSLFTMGPNIADLYYAMPPKNNIWKYYRQKTSDNRDDKAEMRVEIPDVVKPYIESLRGEGPYWLNKLHELNGTNAVTHSINRQYKRWAQDRGLEEFTFYAARKSFASIAMNAGVDKAIVDECLVHVGDYKMADIYIERDWDRINDANKKFIDYFMSFKPEE